MQRDYWNDELRDLKAASIDAFNLWKSAGRPSSGVTFNMKKDAHYRYKLHLSKSQKLFDQSKNDALHNHLLDKNSTQFWQFSLFMAPGKLILPALMDILNLGT